MNSEISMFFKLVQKDLKPKTLLVLAEKYPQERAIQFAVSHCSHDVPLEIDAYLEEKGITAHIVGPHLHSEGGVSFVVLQSKKYPELGILTLNGCNSSQRTGTVHLNDPRFSQLSIACGCCGGPWYYPQDFTERLQQVCAAHKITGLIFHNHESYYFETGNQRNLAITYIDYIGKGSQEAQFYGEIDRVRLKEAFEGVFAPESEENETLVRLILGLE